MRVRLRPDPTPDELAAMYAEPHDHRRWGAGHDIRVRQTIALGQWLAIECSAKSLADLSCGNYEPGNVRWASAHTQRVNRRTAT